MRSSEQDFDDEDRRTGRNSSIEHSSNMSRVIPCKNLNFGKPKPDVLALTASTLKRKKLDKASAVIQALRSLQVSLRIRNLRHATTYDC